MAESALTLSVDSFWISPYAFSCFVALKEKGLPFEVRAVSLPDKDHHRPEYQRQSMTGRIPMLQHGDFGLSESSAIVEYLDDACPPYLRARPRAGPADHGMGAQRPDADPRGAPDHDDVLRARHQAPVAGGT